MSPIVVPVPSIADDSVDSFSANAVSMMSRSGAVIWETFPSSLPKEIRV